jgi:hypothetical protein
LWNGLSAHSLNGFTSLVPYYAFSEEISFSEHTSVSHATSDQINNLILFDKLIINSGNNIKGKMEDTKTITNVGLNNTKFKHKHYSKR